MNYNILIAEDDDQYAALISEIFREKGFSPLVVYNGELALNLILRDSYKLIVLDLFMPGINGLDVLTVLQLKNIKDKKIFIHTGNVNPFVKERVRTFEDVGLVAKSYEKPTDIDYMAGEIIKLAS